MSTSVLFYFPKWANDLSWFGKSITTLAHPDMALPFVSALHRQVNNRNTFLSGILFEICPGSSGVQTVERKQNYTVRQHNGSLYT